MQPEKRSWYVVFTKSRCEKKVHKSLTDRGFEAYCPLNRVKKKWSDRFKWVEEPLFRSFVFVRITDSEHTSVRMVSGAVNFIYWLGKPAVVRDKEIETIRSFLNEYTDVQVEELKLKPNSRIKIRKGAFMDKEGKVVKVMKNKVRVVIESIGYSLVAVIDKSNAASADT